MTALNQVNAYLRRVELRLRLFAAARGMAVVAAVALLLTVLLVWTGNRYEFAQHVVLPLRVFLFLCLAASISLVLVLPLLRLNRRRVIHLAEQRISGFEERLLTVAERPDTANPFTELVAEDVMRIARKHPAGELSSKRLLLACGGSGIAAALILIWLITAGPGYWGYGAGLLWTGSGNLEKRPLYDVKVLPGNKTVRRKSDQVISAQLINFSAERVILYARYRGATKWESTPMQPKQNGSGYQFLFAGLSDSVEYYVRANAARSQHYTLTVKDLPGVKRVRVSVQFPSGLHLQNVVEDPGGDIRAVAGSNADISVLTDRPLPRGYLVLEDGSKIALRPGDGNWLTAHLPIQKDGSYHVAALDGNELVRIGDDYFIEAKKDEPPSVRILRPGGDPRVSPIEEVPVAAEASDDFGVENLELHYSVNGGPEQVVALSKKKDSKAVEGTTTLYLENYKLQPGDLISLYATAKDANTTSRSDIVFAQAEPFDFKFSQSQSAGGMGMGMGMGGGQDGNISERQKQIIAATWNELRETNKSRAALQEDAHFLSDLQGKLGEQAKTLAERMGNRELAAPGSTFENFSKMMTQASAEMGDAVGALKPGKWHDALTPEQHALQSLLRAEALFRDIQVAFGQNGGGGGGGGAQRDLARMFDLELDTSKNQYETQQSASQTQSDQQKAIDDAFERLQMLARRQQELAAQNNQQQPVEQRWQEEQLRREAEELRRQLEQLAQNSQGQPQSNSSQNGQQSASSASASGQRGQSQGGRRSSASSQQNQELSRAMQQSLESLRRAEDEMRRTVSEHDASAQQRAAAQLAEAQDTLNRALHQQAGNSVEQMADKAQQIADAQRDLANRLKQMYGAKDTQSRFGEGQSTLPDGSAEMPEMNDPNNLGFYGYRRRYWQQELMPRRPATPQERDVANEKEKLAQQLDQLQHDMQHEQQNLAGTQPDASSKMRRALSEAEEKELALRMQKNAEWIRQGYGDRNLGMEDSVTAGVDQLARDLRDTQAALNAGSSGSNKTDQRTEQALAQVRGLRQMLEQARRESHGQQGPGQQGTEQTGRAQPGGGQPQTGGQGAENGQYSPLGGGNPGIDRRGLQDAIGQLYAYRRQIDPRDRTLYNYIDGTLGYLRDLNANPAVLQSAINQDAVSSLERLEMELSRRVGQQQTNSARTTTPESSPEKYREAVAAYFKKLSQPK